MKTKLENKLNDLIETADRLAELEHPTKEQRKELTALREEARIYLIEAMDSVSRLIDPEHPYFRPYFEEKE